MTINEYIYYTCFKINMFQVLGEFITYDKLLGWYIVFSNNIIISSLSVFVSISQKSTNNEKNGRIVGYQIAVVDE